MSERKDKWSSLLGEFNKFVFETPILSNRLPDPMKESGWCGAKPATPADLAAAEARLGVVLPTSYRNFLSLADGWWSFGSFVPRLWSSTEIGWYKDLRPQRLADEMAIWADSPSANVSDKEYFDYANRDAGLFRIAYLSDCLLIAEGIDDEMIFLNPRVTFSDGEWEAWFFASWIPGVQRYRSFGELFELFLDTEKRSWEIERRMM